MVTHHCWWVAGEIEVYLKSRPLWLLPPPPLHFSLFLDSPPVNILNTSLNLPPSHPSKILPSSPPSLGLTQFTRTTNSDPKLTKVETQRAKQCWSTTSLPLGCFPPLRIAYPHSHSHWHWHWHCSSNTGIVDRLPLLHLLSQWHCSSAIARGHS